MTRIQNIKVYDLKESIIACRNAMRIVPPQYTEEEFELSLERAKKLCKTKSNSGHQTFLSGIRVSFDIIYPNYLSPELQRYHWIDIVTSSSKMHRLMEMDMEMACNKYVSKSMINEMRQHIQLYKDIQATDEIVDMEFYLRDDSRIIAKDKDEALYIAFMICLSNCPQGIELFMRVSTNYQQLKTIYHQRKNHRLKEDWGELCKMIEKLPFFEELIKN